MSPPLRETLGSCPPGTKFTINDLIFRGTQLTLAEIIKTPDGKNIASYKCLTRSGGLNRAGEVTLGASQDYPEGEIQILP